MKILLLLLFPVLLQAHPYQYYRPRPKRPVYDKLRKLFDNLGPSSEKAAVLTPIVPLPDPVKLNRLEVPILSWLIIYDNYDTISGKHLEYGIKVRIK